VQVVADIANWVPVTRDGAPVTVKVPLLELVNVTVLDVEVVVLGWVRKFRLLGVSAPPIVLLPTSVALAGAELLSTQNLLLSPEAGV